MTARPTVIAQRIEPCSFTPDPVRQPCTVGEWRRDAQRRNRYIQCTGPRIYTISWKWLNRHTGVYVPERRRVCPPHAEEFSQKHGLAMPEIGAAAEMAS